MKFNVTVELDWIDDGHNLDKEIKDDVIQRITETVSKKLIEEKTTQLQEEIARRVDDIVDQTYEQFLDNPVQQFDRYGDPTNKFDSVKDMLKYKLDNYMSQKVSGRTGKVDDYRSNNDTTRLEYMVGKQLGEVFDKKVKEVRAMVHKKLSQVEEQINETIKTAMKAEIGERMHKVLEMDNLLGTGGN